MAFMESTNPNYFVATSEDRTASQTARANVQGTGDIAQNVARQRQAAADARVALGGSSQSSGGVTYYDAGGYPISIDPAMAEEQIARQNAQPSSTPSLSEQGMSARPSGYGTQPINPFNFTQNPISNAPPSILNTNTQIVAQVTKPGYQQETQIEKNVFITTSKDFASPFAGGTSQLVNNPTGSGLVMSGQARQNALNAPINFEATRANLPLELAESYLTGVSFGAYGAAKAAGSIIVATRTKPTAGQTRESIDMNIAEITALPLNPNLFLTSGTPVGDIVSLTTALAVGGIQGKLFSGSADALANRDFLAAQPKTDIAIKSANRYWVNGKETTAESGEFITKSPKEFSMGEFKAVRPAMIGESSVEMSGVKIDINQPSRFDVFKGLLTGHPAEEKISSTFVMGKSFGLGEQEPPVGLTGVSGSRMKFIDSFEKTGDDSASFSSYYKFSNAGIKTGYGSDFANLADLRPMVTRDIATETVMTLPADTKGGAGVTGTAGNLFRTSDPLVGMISSKGFSSGEGIGKMVSFSIDKPIASGGRVMLSSPDTFGLGGMGGGSTESPFAGWDLAGGAFAGLGAATGNKLHWSDTPVNYGSNSQTPNVNKASDNSIYSSSTGLGLGQGLGLGSGSISQQGTGAQTGIQTGILTQTGLQSQTQTQTQTGLQTGLQSGLQLIQTPKFDLRLSSMGGLSFPSNISTLKKSRPMFSPNKGGMKKDKSYTLPTADLFSIDRTFKNTGKVSFAASPSAIRAFGLSQGNPFANFPTSYEFKKRGGFNL